MVQWVVLVCVQCQVYQWKSLNWVISSRSLGNWNRERDTHTTDKVKEAPRREGGKELRHFHPKRMTALEEIERHHWNRRSDAASLKLAAASDACLSFLSVAIGWHASRPHVRAASLFRCSGVRGSRRRWASGSATRDH